MMLNIDKNYINLFYPRIIIILFVLVVSPMLLQLLPRASENSQGPFLRSQSKCPSGVKQSTLGAVVEYRLYLTHLLSPQPGS